MDTLEALRQELSVPPPSTHYLLPVFMARGYAAHLDEPTVIARAYAAQALFTLHCKHIYANDRVAGSLRGMFPEEEAPSEAESRLAQELVDSYGRNTFLTNADHFAPGYEEFLTEGVAGTLQKIARSRVAHRQDADASKKEAFLQAAEITMRAFGRMAEQYGDAAAATAESVTDPERRRDLLAMADACHKVAVSPPETFREALQLVWLAHLAFQYEGRYAMALGRLDQYLYPFYQKDLAAGRLTREEARSLLACTFLKIGEHRYIGGDDVVNIAIGGVRRDGQGGVNDLSYDILEAVRRCNIPGPNLSARLYEGAPDEFLDACLQVIGTGLGYPALMNDEVNIPALRRHGYSLEDCRDYCMVGCIENFIPGKQPPWSDGRYNTPKYIELALNNGRCLQTGARMGPETGEPSGFETMEDFLAALKAQMVYGAADYMARFRNENDRYNRTAYAQPFLSCFCEDCLARGLDINDGGARYPSAHGAGCMGIATVADSLAAIERAVFEEKRISLDGLRDALAADFVGYEELRAQLRAMPKYGNNDDFVDKYAVWFVQVQEEIFARYRTPDGGPIYTAIASNVNNIPAGKVVAATPDGRRNGEPLSDAASPGHGMDRQGPTAVVLSVTKPDYTLVSCGTVLNQKFSPSVFRDPEKRAKLRALIRVYFQKGGQEMQINAVSREMLQDASAHPEAYENLVVRVSGFSAYYTCLDPAVQADILERTEHA